jgi:hypothetical protein
MQITDGLIKERLVNMSGKRGNGVHLVWEGAKREEFNA